MHSRRLRYPLLVLHPQSPSTSSALRASYEPLAATGGGLPCELSLVNARVSALHPRVSVALFVHRVAYECAVAMRTRALNTECRAPSNATGVPTSVRALFGGHSPNSVHRTTLNALGNLDELEPDSFLNVGMGHVETYKLEF